MNRTVTSALLALLCLVLAFNIYERRAKRVSATAPVVVDAPFDTATPAPTTSATSTEIVATLKPEQRAIFVLNQNEKYSDAIVAADTWLAKHPSDGLTMLQRQRALASVLKKETITFGLSAPFSGSLKQIGEAFAQGVALAVTEANAAGGVNKKWVTIDIQNDQGDKAKAIVVASKFLANEKILGVIGPYSSSTVLASSEIYNQGLPIIAPAATNPRVTGAGPYIYRVAPSDASQGASLARLAQSKGAKNVAVLYDTNDAYSKGLALAFESEATKIGLGTTDFLITLNNINDAVVGNYAVDAIFVSGYMDDVARVAELEAGFPKKLLLAGDGAYGQELLAKGGRYVQGALVTTFFHADALDKGSKVFTKKFRARFGGGTPNANAMQAYDATRTMMEALRRVTEARENFNSKTNPSKVVVFPYTSQPSREALLDGLETFRTVPGLGVTAPIRFDSNGDVKDRPFVVVSVGAGLKGNVFKAEGLAP